MQNLQPRVLGGVAGAAGGRQARQVAGLEYPIRSVAHPSGGQGLL